MQQQELAQMRQRDANLTALAAIGPRKKRKIDSPGATLSGTEVSASFHVTILVLPKFYSFLFDFCLPALCLTPPPIPCIVLNLSHNSL